MFHGIVGKTNVYDLNLDMAVTFEHCQIEVKSEGIAALLAEFTKLLQLGQRSISMQLYS